MYSRRVIDLVIDGFEAKNGWRPRYHSIAEVDEFNEYVSRITKDDGNGQNSYFIWRNGPPSGERIRWIKRRMANEKFLIFSDAEYFITRYAKIRGVDEQIIRMEFRIGQQVVFKMLQEFDDLQVAIQLFCLKCRQVGITSVMAMFFLHRILTRSNTHAIMASASIPQSEKMNIMIKTALDRMPFWLKPNRTSTREKEPRWENGSAMSIQAGSQTVAIAEGSSPSCIHLCLAPDTLVRLGSHICRIADIPDYNHGYSHALTSRGRYQQIKGAWRSNRGQEVGCELTLWGNYSPLLVTRDHPILTPDGFTAAENIGKGDFVSVPVRPITHRIDTSQMFHRSSGRPGQKGKGKSEDVRLTREWGWLCGLYLSEGSLQYSRSKLASSVYFTIHQKEMAPRLLGVKSAVGILQHVRYYASKRSLAGQISIANSGLARWFESCFGSRADSKSIPDWAWTAGREFCEGIVQGYFEGDGHIPESKNEMCGHSISQSLVFQMRDMIASLGYGWTSIYHREAGELYGRNCKAIWTINCAGSTGRRMRELLNTKNIDFPENRSAWTQKWKYSLDKKFVHVKVFSNLPRVGSEWWDLEVDAPEHDFTTIHCCVKNSEIADYDNPVKTIEQGLFPAAHQTSSLFFVMEGTGDIASPWQKEKWEFYKANRGKPGGRFRTVYIPPCCAPDIYPHADWLRANPVPEGWYARRNIETKRMANRGQLFVRSTDYLAEFFGDDWEMPVQYQWYWECGYMEALASNSVKTYMSQNAVTDTDAFQSKFDPVFRDEVIDVVIKERERKIKAYAITGKTIIIGGDNKPYSPPEHEIDYSQERIELSWEGPDGNKYEWTLIPLFPPDLPDEDKFTDQSDQLCFDKLLVYEDPRDGAHYSEGIDCAHGLGLENEERACCAVARNQYGSKRDINVASFTSISVNSAQMSRIAACIATYFTTDGNGVITSSNPLGMRFIIEQIRKAGDECQHQLKLMGFYDHHVMHSYDGKGPVQESKGAKEGWRTTHAWSRDFLLQRFINAVTGGWYKPNDPICIRQMKTFVRRMKLGRATLMHDAGEFDDNIFAHAMAYLTAHDIEDDAQRLQSKYQAAVPEPKVSDGWCNSNLVTM